MPDEIRYLVPKLRRIVFSSPFWVTELLQQYGLIWTLSDHGPNVFALDVSEEYDFAEMLDRLSYILTGKHQEEPNEEAVEEEKILTMMSYYSEEERRIVFVAPAWVALLFDVWGTVERVGPSGANLNALTVHTFYTDFDGVVDKVSRVLSGLNRREAPKKPVHNLYVQLNFDTGPFKAAIAEIVEFNASLVAKSHMHNPNPDESETKFKLVSPSPFEWGFGFYSGPKTAALARGFGEVRQYTDYRYSFWASKEIGISGYSDFVAKTLEAYNRAVRGD